MVKIFLLGLEEIQVKNKFATFSKMVILPHSPGPYHNFFFFIISEIIITSWKEWQKSSEFA